jgi:hypothetical protein
LRAFLSVPLALMSAVSRVALMSSRPPGLEKSANRHVEFQQDIELRLRQDSLPTVEAHEAALLRLRRSSNQGPKGLSRTIRSYGPTLWILFVRPVLT